jgi:hypothetical protein
VEDHRNLDLFEWVHPIDSVTSEALIRDVDRMMVQREQLAAQLAVKIDAYRAKYPPLTSAVHEVLRSAGLVPLAMGELEQCPSPNRR